MQLFKYFHTENTTAIKNGGSCEQLLSEIDFEAVLFNFCCDAYGANAEAIQKISTRTLLAGVMPTHTKTGNFKATPKKKTYLTAYYLLIGRYKPGFCFFPDK